MIARFRIVHFVPDPYSGGRLPIAALVSVDGRVTVARADDKWQECLPHDARSAIAVILAELGTGTRAGWLPPTVGPHAVLGEERSIPSGVSEPVEWVLTSILRTTGAGVGEEQVAERRNAGYRFFQSENVAQFISRDFTVDQAPPGFPRVLPKVSHYVTGSAKLLLLEPIVASASGIERTLRRVGTSFLAWQRSFELASPRAVEILPEFIAYVLPDHARVTAADVRDELRGVATSVVDVSTDVERASFVAKIREVGRTQTMLH